MPGQRRADRRRKSRLALLVACGLAALGLAACSGSGSSPAAPPTSPAGTPSARPLALPVSHPTVWLCRPGMADNPCAGGLDTTVVQPDGSTSLQRFTPATNPKVDCFYIYPTVSEATTATAPLSPEPAQIAVTRAQVGRFQSVCRLFVPVYRQITLAGLGKLGITPKDSALANQDVDSAWNDYLDHDNDGRGVILIGHSQGAGQLIRLLRDDVEKNPAELSRLVAAYVIGGNLLVPKGKDVGGDLQRIPACRSGDQHGCVVAYSSFDTVPPATALFGRPAAAFQSLIPSDQRGDMQVLCTNPAALGASTGTSELLHPYLVTRHMKDAGHLPGVTSLSLLPAASTDFLAYPGQVRGACEHQDGASWLQIDHPTSGPAAPPIAATLGPVWGLHLFDMQVTQGDLIALAAKEAASWHS